MNSILEVYDAFNYPVEFFNYHNPIGFSSHLLTLKIDTPIMFLRNFSTPKLCNWIRLRITGLQNILIEAKIMTGSAKIKSDFFLYTPMISSDYPFHSKNAISS